MKSHILHIIRYTAATLIALAVVACSTTRKLEPGEKLYTGLKGITYKTPQGVEIPSGIKSQLNTAADAPTNKKWLYIFPMGLWVYNNMDSHEKGIKKWIYNKFVQDPVIISDVRPEVRTKMINEIMHDNGYFSAKSSYDLIPAKNKKKVKVAYTVNSGNPYLIDSIQLLPDTCLLNHTIDSIALKQPYLTPGVRFSVDSLATVRTRIANSMRNRGYYFFTPEFIDYLADSIQNPGSIILRLDIAKNTPAFSLAKYYTGDVTVHVNRNQGGGTPDTIATRNCNIIQMKPSKLRTRAITDNVTFRKGRIFSVRNMNRTQSYLAQLGIFNSIDINVVPDSASFAQLRLHPHDSTLMPKLNIDINCTFDMPIEVSVEANVSSKSNSYLGPGIVVGLTNRNLFGGGELLSTKLTGSYEWQTGHGRSTIFNSYEAGLTASLSFPRLIAPKFVPRRRHSSNWTRVTLNAELLNRPHYFKIAQLNTSFGYDWMSTRYANNNLTLFKLTYTKLRHTTEVFDSIMAANPAVALSFRNQFIPQASYTYTYDRTYPDHAVNYYVTVSEAGNLFWSIWEIAGVKGEKKLVGTPFSQFVKGRAQFVYGHRITDGGWLWGRIGAGAVHAYGNSSQVPYIEQFYCGGANSVRAFPVRSIGPGSYHIPDGQINGYFDQTGTFLFEANLEYRFHIIGPLNGALFLDSGNIWLLRHDPQRPGGTLEGKSFFKDLALGTGLGLRVDIGMLVLRGDLGIGIHAPYDTGKTGYYNMTSFGKSLAFHLAIGYPF